jgi:transcriptional regulator with XRE-family HTH domain
MKVLAERLKRLQAEYDDGRGISNEKLAQRIESSTKSVQTWRNDAGDPSIKFLMRLADFFDVEPNYLLGCTDDRRPRPASAHVPRHWVAQR